MEKHLLRICLFFLFTSVELFASDLTVRLLQRSNSGKTLVVDKGAWEGAKLNDIALIIRPETTQTGQTKLRPIARLRSVKLFDTTSIWVILEEFEKLEFKDKMKVYLLTESDLLQGRKELSMGRSSLVSNISEAKDFTKNQMKQDQLHLSKKKDNYDEAKVLHKNRKIPSKDIELLDIDKWEGSEASRHVSRSSLYRSQYAEDFSTRKRIATFDKMAAHFIEKFSHPHFNRDYFFDEQKRDANNDFFQDSSLKNTLYDRTVMERAKDREAQAKLLREFKEKGPAWSDDYSDEELSELVTRAGVTSEILRQEEKVMSRYRGNFIASFNLNIFDNENNLDPDNHQNNRYDLEVGMEFWPFKKFDNAISKFTLELAFRRGKDGFEADYYNALSTDYSLSGFINFYPFRTPSDVNRNVFFLGLGLRTGYANLEIPSIGEKGNYQLLSFPALRAGFKYSFYNGYGARMTFTYENSNFSRIETNQLTTGALKDNLSLTEGKLGMSLIKLF